jgi:hypothetical protein
MTKLNFKPNPDLIEYIDTAIDQAFYQINN